MGKDIISLAHIKWRCQYHFAFFSHVCLGESKRKETAVIDCLLSVLNRTCAVGSDGVIPFAFVKEVGGSV